MRDSLIYTFDLIIFQGKTPTPNLKLLSLVRDPKPMVSSRTPL